MGLQNFLLPGPVPARERPFFAVAAQGRNDARAYLLSVSLMLGLVVLVEVFLAAALFGLVSSGLIPFPRSAMPPHVIMLGGGAAALMLLGAVILTRAIHKRPALTLITPTGRLCWFRLVLGFVIWGVIIVVSLSPMALQPGGLPTPPLGIPFMAFVLGLVLLVPPQVILCELAFRGYLTQAIVLRTGSAVLSLVPIVVMCFAMSFAGLTGFFGLLAIIMRELGYSISSLRDGRTELAIGANMAQTLVSSFLYGALFFPSGTLRATPATGRNFTSIEQFGLVGPLWVAVMITVFVLTTEAVLRRRRV